MPVSLCFFSFAFLFLAFLPSLLPLKLVKLCRLVQAILQIPLIVTVQGKVPEQLQRIWISSFSMGLPIWFTAIGYPTRDFCLAQLGLRIECSGLWLPTWCFLSSHVDVLKGNMPNYNVLLTWDWKDLVTPVSPSPNQCEIIPSRVFLRLFK